MGLQSSSSASTLQVEKFPSYLQFAQCCTKNIPGTKPDVKQVIETLQCFADHGLLQGRDVHKLTKNGKYPHTNALLKKHPTKQLYSVDVYHRGGANGKMRLIYYRDPVNEAVGQVVALFFDTHK